MDYACRKKNTREHGIWALYEFSFIYFLGCSHLKLFLSYNEEAEKLQKYVQAQVNC